MYFLRFLREGWGEFQNGVYLEGEESIKKSVFTEFTSSEKDSAYKKWNSKWGSRTQQHVYCLHVHYAHSQHIESYLGKNQPHVKILIAFLFRQLHFNK